MIAAISQMRSTQRSAGRGIDPTGAAFVAVVAATVAVVTAVAGSWAALVGALAAGMAAGWTDARTGRIPNRLVLLAACSVLFGVVALGAAPVAVGSVLAGAAGAACPLLLVHLVSPDAVGFGDVKLAAALGGAVGLVDPRLGLVALCVASGGAAAYGLLGRRASIALGPWLCVGAVAAVVVGAVTGRVGA